MNKQDFKKQITYDLDETELHFIVKFKGKKIGIIKKPSDYFFFVPIMSFGDNKSWILEEKLDDSIKKLLVYLEEAIEFVGLLK